MARFKVLAPLEHNQVLYVPEDHGPVIGSTPVVDEQGKATGERVRSGGHGNPVPVDRSGEVELSPAHSAPLLALGGQTPEGKWHGVIAPVKKGGKAKPEAK